MTEGKTKEWYEYKPETVAEMEEAILALLRFENHVSFAELGNKFATFRSTGDVHHAIRNGMGWILWEGMSEIGSQAIDNLFTQKKVWIQPASLLIYLADGMTLRYPLVKRRIRYKEDRWCPTVLCRPGTKGAAPMGSQ